MKAYKDIINFELIRKLKTQIHDIYVIYNNLVTDNNVEKRESEYYEVYTDQYKKDVSNLTDLRNRCLKIADMCNNVLLNMNTYHIKQYYLNPNELDGYEFSDEYKSQNFDKPTQKPTEAPAKVIYDDDDMW